MQKGGPSFPLTRRDESPKNALAPSPDTLPNWRPGLDVGDASHNLTGSPGKGGNHAQAHRQNSHRGALSELVEKRKENEKVRNEDVYRRLLPSEILDLRSSRADDTSGRASERAKRESERGGRREPTPRRGKFTGKISGKLQSRSSDSRLYPHPGVRGVSAESSSAFALSRQRCLWPAATASSGGSSDSGRGGRTTLRVPPHQAAKRSIQGRQGHAPSQHQTTPQIPPPPRRRSCCDVRGGEGRARAARCGGEPNGGGSRNTEHTRPTRCRGGVEAADRGGAGKRAVRQRDPTWALRCPAFPSLKYYSVRREREPRSPASPRRRFHATSNALSPPPRHGPRNVRVCRGVGHGFGVLGFFLPVGPPHSSTRIIGKSALRVRPR